jgi:hypothetical protein
MAFMPEIVPFRHPTCPCVQAIAQEKQKITFVHVQRENLYAVAEEEMNVGVLQDKTICYFSK